MSSEEDLRVLRPVESGGAEPAEQKPSASLFRLPASATFTVDQALIAAREDDLSEVLIAGYDKDGQLVVRSSRLTCAEGAFLAQKALNWALSGGKT